MGISKLTRSQIMSIMEAVGYNKADYIDDLKSEKTALSTPFASLIGDDTDTHGYEIQANRQSPEKIATVASNLAIAQFVYMAADKTPIMLELAKRMGMAIKSYRKDLEILIANKTGTMFILPDNKLTRRITDATMAWYQYALQTGIIPKTLNMQASMELLVSRRPSQSHLEDLIQKSDKYDAARYEWMNKTIPAGAFLHLVISLLDNYGSNLDSQLKKEIQIAGREFLAVAQARFVANDPSLPIQKSSPFFRLDYWELVNRLTHSVYGASKSDLQQFMPK